MRELESINGVVWCLAKPGWCVLSRYFGATRAGSVQNGVPGVTSLVQQEGVGPANGPGYSPHTGNVNLFC
jgi:hypothetical protein